MLARSAVLALALASLAARAFSASPCEALAVPGSHPFTPELVGLTVEQVWLYPSLDKRTSLTLGEPGSPWAIPVKDAEVFRIFRERKENVSELRIDAFRFQAGPPGGTGFFYLFIDPGLVAEGDLMHICVEGRKNDRPALLALEQAVKVGAFAPSYTLRLEGSYNASQDLRNGQKRPVGRVETSLSIPRLQFSPSWARWYFRGDALISSDGKDRGSRVAFASGLERSLVKSWYLPAYLEGRTQGDQVRDNQSVIATLGVKTVLPWKLLSALKPVLNNAVVKTPFAPDVSIALQNEWRVEQDLRARATFPNKRGLRWFGAANWSPFHLLPGPARDGVIAPGNLALEFALKGWYLYGNEIQQNHRWQGLAEASLLVPITGLSFQAATGSLTGAEAPKQRVRIKYSAGANESRGFINSSQLTIGLEVIK